jgi:hypothetical protein
MAEFATATDVANLWRPLTSEEQTRATHLIGVASRRVRRDFPDVDARLTAGTLALADVRDVVASMVIPVLGAAPVPGARSWSVSSGAESRTVQVGSTVSGNPLDLFEFAGWMLDILAPNRAKVATPVAYMPAGGGVSALFPMSPEVYS